MDYTTRGLAAEIQKALASLAVCHTETLKELNARDIKREGLGEAINKLSEIREGLRGLVDALDGRGVSLIDRCDEAVRLIDEAMP